MPFTLFCHKYSPQKARDFFEQHNALIEGNQENWKATYVFSVDESAGEERRITFTYDQDWCSPPNWPNQILGMQNFVGKFEMDDERLHRVQTLILQFQFCIGIIEDPDIEDWEDRRLEVMHALAAHMDGVFFTPGALLDSQYRPFAAGDGECDPDAIIPLVDQASQIETVDEDEPDDIPDPVPPTADRIARRMYALLAGAARGLLDMNLGMGNEPAYRLQELHDWFEALDIMDELEPREKAILFTPERELADQDVLNSVWRLEGLVVLAWSLQLTDLPDYDELVETDELLKALSLLDGPMCQHNLQHAELRSSVELERYNDEIFSFNWRMVDFRVRPEAIDYANVDFGYGQFDLSWAMLKDGDLALQSMPLAEADPELVQTMNSAAVERHKASNWLRGDDELYSEVDTST